MSERAQTRAMKRKGRCYELAWKSLHDMKDPGDWRVAHGEVNALGKDDSVRIGHAWLESEIEVFDPVPNKICRRGDFYRHFRSTKLNRSSLTELAKMIAEQGHFGPWRDDVLTRSQ